jgi:hypothetical protein
VTGEARSQGRAAAVRVARARPGLAAGALPPTPPSRHGSKIEAGLAAIFRHQPAR